MHSRFAEQDESQDFDYRRLPSFSEDRAERRDESPEPSSRVEEEPEESRWPWSLGRRTSQSRAASRGVPGVVVVGSDGEELDPDPEHHHPPSPTGSTYSKRSTVPDQNGKKATGGKRPDRKSLARRGTWLIINSDGFKSTIVSDKRGIIQKYKLGVPIRDMRLLDPHLATNETGRILVRDNAIVFSVEHVRLIITADLVIIPRDGYEQRPNNIMFVEHLDQSIADGVQEENARLAAAQRAAGPEFDEDFMSQSSASRFETAQLPFELRVLETSLRDVTRLCTGLSKEIEADAFPALEALTKKVITKNLERVRRVKTRHQRLSTRVETVRDELQRFLEDDDDMIKMCLTRKQALLRGQVSHTGAGSGDHSVHGRQGGYSLGRNSVSRAYSTERHAPAQGGSPEGPTDSAHSGALPAVEDDSAESVELVENLLESYFMEVDTAYDRLENLEENIRDTEEFVNFELDSSRNRLIRLEIVLTAATFGLAIFGTVAGILGENLIIPPTITKSVFEFGLVNLVTLAICIACVMGIILYVKAKRLM